MTDTPPVPGFAEGVRYPLRGARLIWRERRLWPFVATPAAVTTVLMAAAWYAALQVAPGLIDYIFHRPDGGGWLVSLMKGAWLVTNAVVHILTIGLFSVLALFAGSILASPVYDQLTARVERLELGSREEAFALKLVAADVLMGVTHSLMALTLYLSLACPITAMGLVPVVGQGVNLVLGPALSALFLAREVLDYSFSRRRFGFAQKVRILRRHLPMTAGLGLSTLGLLAIPGVNVLSMPLAVVGGALAYCDLERSGSLREERGLGEQG